MLHRFKPALLALPLAVAGCAALPTDPATAADHPANPDAPTAALPPPSATLAIADAGASGPLPPDRHDHAGPGDDDPMAPLPGDAPSHDHAATGHGTPGAAGTNAPTTAPATQAAVAYVCPMHPEVRAVEPGRCPICGMRLVEREGGAE